ncbi:hypothetical protein [Amycolatopsis keratiniphila]|uniref:hypothetical protein n=1 Tax=Amycolatopsis keratiniphila TaxID=129921 RepID=UPI00087D9371|nr:hypothetical protein [Amycolatopsis keratiniphila]OLZ56090.1 hypothetical protein BS330_18340 [Amycolatopsis keratiniphila subsp. nogabecina]SDU51720.1 hypothetical protein SAMN04489733_5332 [Amycolatopsis keratiniphila]
MFGRDNDFGFSSYADYVAWWRVSALRNVSYAVRRNIIVAAALLGIDLLVLDGYWLAWPVRAVVVFLGWNTWRWLRFRSGIRQGRVYPDRYSLNFSDRPDDGRGWRHG